MSESNIVPIKDLFLPGLEPTTLEERAQRIRDLVAVTRGCILEIGRQLIAAREDPNLADRIIWQAWLKDEFGWKESTAYKYISVAKAFLVGITGKSNSEPKTVTLNAMYVLASDDISTETRAAALTRAEAGETITKTKAEEMVQAARQDLAKQVREELRKEHEAAIKTAVKAAVETAAGEIRDLRDELDQRDADEAEPSLDRAIEILLQLTKRKRPSAAMLHALATEFNQPLTFAGKTYPPTDPETAKKATQDMAKSGEFSRHLAYFADEVLPPAELLKIIPPFMLGGKGGARLKDNIRAVQEWLRGFTRLLG